MKYDYSHSHIEQLITTVCTENANSSSVSDFTHYYLAPFHTMICQNRFDDEYIRKLSTYDALSRLTKLAADYGCVDTLSYNALFNFMTKYSGKLECGVCKTVMLEHNVECSACGCLVKTFCSTTIPRAGYDSSFAIENLKHSPMKHCELWLLHPQGKEHATMSHEELTSLLKLAESACNDDFTCKVIRSYSKKLHITRYNPNIPWIRE